ncbi:MAG: hypothetical protein ACJ72S_16380, partial [Nitrososphaeraceae archaeon]
MILKYIFVLIDGIDSGIITTQAKSHYSHPIIDNETTTPFYHSIRLTRMVISSIIILNLLFLNLLLLIYKGICYRRTKNFNTIDNYDIKAYIIQSTICTNHLFSNLN